MSQNFEHAMDAPFWVWKGLVNNSGFSESPKRDKSDTMHSTRAFMKALMDRTLLLIFQ